ncbi:MAG: Stp1/IreP family PP2C-type Ser/Thr phosphatase [Butyribacter sp.]|nr:Stp1/IreP family PP2C-type Ser/Thr phosphatase [bacterium]MDY3855145.1 Stp1/IreP family PP2C-type Ser/Thr phosphatase [Butyribacter sp.]
MKAFAKTDIGKKRSMNQDSFYCNETSVGSFQNLFIVADGMGGHKAGDQASKLCIEQMTDTISESVHKTPVSIFEEAVEKANKAVYEKAKANIEFEGMGTTMVACTIQNDTMYVANIGDSRLYLLREKLRQITDDHSLVEEMVKQGNLTESEARIHPQKNIITRALGTEEQVSADYFEVNVSKGDIILLCSDGLTNMVEDDDIEYIISQNASLEEAGKLLVEKAKQNGGDDNITALLAKVE